MSADTTGRAAHDSPSSAAPARSEGDPCRWVVFATPELRTKRAQDRPVRLRRVVLQLAAAAVAVLTLVGIGGAIISRHTAENESVHEAAQLTDLLAESLVQPALTDAMATDATALRRGLDTLVRRRILSASLVRVKIWTPQGTIIYSDESRIVGQHFGLDAGARAAFADPQTRAEVSDLSQPENRFERSYGKLLEVYRPVWTPAGRPLLFETYFHYELVSARTSQLWRGFVGIIFSSLAAIFVLLLPLVWTLLARARRAQAQREAMMQRAVEASDEERRRIAATLHDGIVQELAAASYAVAGGAEAASARGDAQLAGTLRDASTSVRTSLGAMRSLLVDIYPPNLRSAGLGAALHDLAATLAGREPTVVVDVDEAAAGRLSEQQERAVFRVAQETLRNAVSHSRASRAEVTLREVEGGVELTVADNGTGFDVAGTRAEDHFGLRLIADAADAIQGLLRVSSGADGTTWELQVPR